ncbi:MAG: lipase family protein [Candidatus Omnitrophica bacterium]|nr:lipase family protein [Candidatus Omnitrophota bacterium]
MPAFEFHPAATGFDLLNALRLAELSKLSYQPLEQAGAFLKQELGFTQYRSFDQDDTQAFLVANDTVVVVAFRGTSSTQDWLTDARIKLVPVNNKKVHFGFNQALDRVWPELSDAVSSSRGPEQTLWVTGHSLGGALAMLATDRFTDQGLWVDGLYTFGQPRVGDQHFAQEFDVKMQWRAFRFVNDEDLVTRVPPPPGYRHTGAMCFFDNKGGLYRDNIFWNWWRSVSEGVALRTQAGAAATALSNPNGPGDHNLDHYLRNLREQYRRETKSTGSNTFEDYINNK